MYPYGYICLSEGVHLRYSNRKEKRFIYFLFPNIYTYISEHYFQKQMNFEINRNKLILRHKNGVYFYGFKNLKVLIKFQWIFVI